MKTWCTGLGWLAVLCGVGCSDAESSRPDGMSGAGGGGAAGASATGGDAAAGRGAAGNGGANLGGAATGTPVELPPGSRELDSVVNLVDAEAEAELEAFFADQAPSHPTQRRSLTKSLNLFLEHYEEDYDFVYLVNGRTDDSWSVAGKFEAVTAHAEPGGSQPIELAASGYKTNGRIKGVIGIPYRAMYYPPLSHELVHYWAQFLDPGFGFGVMLDEDWGPHWGASSVNGQLGGFDGSTLRCLTPAGGVPPACTALPSGRTRYVVGAFGPNANGFRSAPFGSLELYLMGLIPGSEVDTSFQLLEQAQIDYEAFDETTQSLQVEASGITSLPFADIVARHGSRALLPENQRAFKAAFVVVTAEPAPDAVLTDVARWAAIFGNRLQYGGWSSFELDTGGRATLDTALGARRTSANPAPAARAATSCDALLQDCGRPELSCYLGVSGYCAIHQGVQQGEPCDSDYSCAPGLDCFSGVTPNVFTCQAYCDSTNLTAPKGCQTLCPGGHIRLTSGSVDLGGVCQGP